MKKLSECRQGDTVLITSLSGKGPVRRRLLDMGFMKGTSLKIIKYAPLKDPLEVIVRSTHVSLRVKEADLIGTEPLIGASESNAPRQHDSVEDL